MNYLYNMFGELVWIDLAPLKYYDFLSQINDDYSY